MSEEQENEVVELNFERLDLQPGDKLVVFYPGTLNTKIAELIERKMKEFIGHDIRVLVLDGGMKLGVLNASKCQPQS